MRFLCCYYLVWICSAECCCLAVAVMPAVASTTPTGTRSGQQSPAPGSSGPTRPLAASTKQWLEQQVAVIAARAAAQKRAEELSVRCSRLRKKHAAVYEEKQELEAKVSTNRQQVEQVQALVTSAAASEDGVHIRQSMQLRFSEHCSQMAALQQQLSLVDDQLDALDAELSFLSGEAQSAQLAVEKADTAVLELRRRMTYMPAADVRLALQTTVEHLASQKHEEQSSSSKVGLVASFAWRHFVIHDPCSYMQRVANYCTVCAKSVLDKRSFPRTSMNCTMLSLSLSTSLCLWCISKRWVPYFYGYISCAGCQTGGCPQGYQPPGRRAAAELPDAGG